MPIWKTGAALSGITQSTNDHMHALHMLFLVAQLIDNR